MLDVVPLLDDLPSVLQTQTFGQVTRGYAATTSTNIRASEWATEGAKEGSLVFAEFQTAGRGRLKRTWEARSGQNLMFSIVLRPVLRPEQFGLITLASSLAVAHALNTFCAPLSARIKWPNDVLLNGRKCCGILLETAHLSQQGQDAVILGIGLNVNQDAFPDDLSQQATSLLLETGRYTPRAPLLAQILYHLEQAYGSLTQDAGTSVRFQYKQLLIGLGQPIAIRQTIQKETCFGNFENISDTGALLLRTKTGLRTFHAGEVTLRTT